MDAGEMARFCAGGLEAAPACGDSLQAGSVAPASETATPDDAPRSKSLRDKPSEHMELGIFLMVCLRANLGQNVSSSPPVLNQAFFSLENIFSFDQGSASGHVSANQLCSSSNKKNGCSVCLNFGNSGRLEGNLNAE
jgi:hypothetical protein